MCIDVKHNTWQVTRHNEREGHCTWDGDCASPEVNTDGPASACHNDEATCTGPCSSQTKAKWCPSGSYHIANTIDCVDCGEKQFHDHAATSLIPPIPVSQHLPSGRVGIVWASGHQHDGALGIQIWVHMPGQAESEKTLVCHSAPVIGSEVDVTGNEAGYITGQMACRRDEPIEVPLGSMVTIRSIYDAHPPKCAPALLFLCRGFWFLYIYSQDMPHAHEKSNFESGISTLHTANCAHTPQVRSGWLFHAKERSHVRSHGRDGLRAPTMGGHGCLRSGCSNHKEQLRWCF